MKITTTFLKECEALVATGETETALEKLLTIADSTGYKSEVLTMSSRWKKFSRDQMNGTLSQEAQTLQNSKINSDLLRLVGALGRELAGEKVVPNLLSVSSKKDNSTSPLFRTYIPILLTALAVWGISYFAYFKPAPNCETIINLAGAWTVYKVDQPDFKMGIANIKQDDCMSDFSLRSALKTQATGEDVDFTSRIGGIHNGEVFFVYENFAGEMGVCRGIAPNEEQTDFTLHCTDLIGFDKNDQPKLSLLFKWKEAVNE